MKKTITIMILLILFPIHVLAYSDKILIGGNPIGIEVHSKGVYVVGYEKVNNKNIAKDSGLKIGDRITQIDNNELHSIQELLKTVTEIKDYNLTIDRKGKEIKIKYKPEKENNTIKLGFFGKDQIFGVGTLSYIDPETKIFASLGHEITESSNLEKFSLENGYIYDADINYINKSRNGNIGEIHADVNNSIIGNIQKNENNGIYGKYTSNYPDLEEIEIATSDEIEEKNAYIRTKIDEEKIKDYEIRILSVNKEEETKNIYFEITDKELLEKTGGIVQGMSGSPIIQNNKIIGIVNYVVIEDSKKGYGILIEKMLKEGDQLLED